MKVVHIIFAVLCAVVLSQCGGVKPKAEDRVEEKSYAPGTRTMKRSVEAGIYSVDFVAEFEAMVEHYWDDFDFDADTSPRI